MRDVGDEEVERILRTMKRKVRWLSSDSCLLLSWPVMVLRPSGDYGICVATQWRTFTTRAVAWLRSKVSRSIKS